MTRIILVAVILAMAAGLIWSFAGQTRAAEQPACVETLAGVIEKLESRAAPYQLVTQEKLPDFVAAAEAAGVKIEGTVTNALLAVLDGILVFGVEIDGRCFSDKPIALTFPVTPAKLSGKQPDGRIFA